MGSSKKVWMYDTFEGMAEPTEYDVNAKTKQQAAVKYQVAKKNTHVDWCYASLEDVKKCCQVSGIDMNSIKFVKGDIRNKDLLESIFREAKLKNDQFEGVIHFAGLKAVGESVKYPLEYWDANVNGSINLLKVMDKYDWPQYIECLTPKSNWNNLIKINDILKNRVQLSLSMQSLEMKTLKEIKRTNWTIKQYLDFVNEVKKEKFTFAESPTKFEAGTMQTAEVVAFSESIKLVEKI